LKTDVRAPKLSEMDMVPLHIHPRTDWATTSMAPRGELTAEETRFLLVHHSASINHYAESDVPSFIRSSYRDHTDRGWIDVAYNFFIDRYGGCWEGRAGSRAGPVVGDATGGNQGYAQSICLIGNFQTEPPAPAAVDALVELLAWIAARDHVDLRPDASVEFTSRGSNLWPAGARVRTRPIAGHREMSRTLCPGDHFFALLQDHITLRAARGAAYRIRTGR
jgi:hypothetical protein